MADNLVHPSNPRKDISRSEEMQSQSRPGNGTGTESDQSSRGSGDGMMQSFKEKIGSAVSKMKQNAADERMLDDITIQRQYGSDDIPDEFGGPVV